MKTITIKLFLVSLLGLAMIGFYSCSQNHSHGEGEHSHEGSHEGHDHGDAADDNKTEVAAASKYMCPMECEGSNLEEPGQCPGCGMDLVLRSEYEKESTDESHDHEGHDHGDHDHGDHDHGDHEGHDHSH